jgi:hypothetical protein
VNELFDHIIHLVVGGGLLIGLLTLGDRYFPRVDKFAVLIGFLILAGYVVWKIEGYRTEKRRGRLLAAAKKAAGETLRGFTFNDGSRGSFTPAGVIQSSNGLVIAIDAKQALVRLIRTGLYPGLGHDWIHELPATMDVDVADHPSCSKKGKPVPSLIFSSEEEDGFKVTAFELAADSVATAKAAVAKLRTQRRN